MCILRLVLACESLAVAVNEGVMSVCSMEDSPFNFANNDTGLKCHTGAEATCSRVDLEHVASALLPTVALLGGEPIAYRGYEPAWCTLHQLLAW